VNFIMYQLSQVELEKGAADPGRNGTGDAAGAGGPNLAEVKGGGTVAAARSGFISRIFRRHAALCLPLHAKTLNPLPFATGRPKYSARCARVKDAGDGRQRTVTNKASCVNTGSQGRRKFCSQLHHSTDASENQQRNDGDDFGNGFVFALTFGGENDVLGRRQQSHSGDRELTGTMITTIHASTVMGVMGFMRLRSTKAMKRASENLVRPAGP